MKNQKSKIKNQNCGIFIFLLTAYCLLLTAGEAHAMHISEGILPLNWAALWFAVAIPFVALGLRKLKILSAQDLSIKPLVGLMAAIVFVVSLMPIPVPTAGTCSHPGGTAIPAILISPTISILVTGVALLIQALFFAHGGLSTWGADVVSMGVVGSFAGYGVFRLLRKFNAGLAVSAFFAGIISDWAIYLTTSVELAAGIRGDSPFWPLFSKIAIAFVPTQLPLGIVEGAMTAGMVNLLFKRRADLLVKLGVIKPEHAGGAI
ncbi:MAG: energy-coupling factor ABC transporter permease [Nitrospirae bacterium]|nr:energy-coupling factor ABC transporter permease [Nitrospirota bacterium]